MTTTSQDPGVPVRFTESGDDAGTGLGDRSFRPDVQGLRAVAILLVVLFHARIAAFGGGYVGVDVFFVISGFVITGVLLREHASDGSTSLRNFYGRRARRIIPAAVLVIVATVVAAYFFLGSSSGRSTAVDGQWATLFLANFHFAASSTNYLASLKPPSPLQNFWSLAVEEQFYIVYPGLFLLAARITSRSSLRIRLACALVIVGVASLALSVSTTATDPAGAFFSPFTRAWELALGGIIALSSEGLLRVPRVLAGVATWVGMAMILVAATTLTSASNYPGWLVAVPVVGTGLVIAGGTSQPRWGPETVLGRRPLQFLGLVSFSWYLWHWPILTIATEQNGNVTPSTADNVLLVLIALVVAIVTYAVLENPVRHWRALVSRRWASLLLGACLVAASLGVTTLAVRSTADTSISAIADAAPGTSCTTEAKAGLSQLRAHPRSSLPPLRTTPPDQTLEMLVIGDSTACTMVAGLTVEGQRYRIHVINGAVIGCGIVSGQIPAYYSEGVDVFAYTKQCQSDADRVEAYALRHAQPDIVLWDSTREMESIVAHTRSGPVDLAVGTPEWTAEMHRRIDARITQLMATGAKVIVVLQAPTVEGPMTHGNTSIDRAYAAMNALLRTETRLHRDQVGVVDLATYVCPSGPPCPYVVHGTVLRGDELHYSPAASLQVATWLVPQILEAARKLPG